MRRFPSRVRDGDSLPAQAYAILTMWGRGWYTLCGGDQPSKVCRGLAKREFPEWAPLIPVALLAKVECRLGTVVRARFSVSWRRSRRVDGLMAPGV